MKEDTTKSAHAILFNEEQLRMGGKDLVLDYVAGAISGSAGVLFGHPLDTVKCQLQVQQAGNQYKGLWDCCVTISKQGLVREEDFSVECRILSSRMDLSMLCSLVHTQPP